MLDTTPVYDSYNGITWLISKLLWCTEYYTGLHIFKEI